MSGLLEEYRGGAPLAIVHPHGGVRIIAALTIGEQGIAFADVGWTQQPSYHPMHLVEGALEGQGPWHVGDARIERLTNGNHDGDLEAWRAWAASSEATPSERRRAEGFLVAMLGEAGLL
ncbi:hypothetical protein [Azospirillum rugosum]|uniref:Uncharacterized protein n=1 Tax=Azospirillum rugosum TaxID=416170 RepID=A0ABS4SX45_9PROT|nr:hypothetical protein [Azospirillum rugosum]MBP2297134.1 hypothetical protein [Azospirillum rugosum]MDQ0530960.1 hypothetical protein [Azospirillum rugosum]